MLGIEILPLHISGIYASSWVLNGGITFYLYILFL
jgi:hypothetical protein